MFQARILEFIRLLVLRVLAVRKNPSFPLSIFKMYVFYTKRSIVLGVNTTGVIIEWQTNLDINLDSD